MEMSSWENDLEANFLSDVESVPMMFFGDVESEQIISPAEYEGSVSPGSAEGSSEGASSGGMAPPDSDSLASSPSPNLRSNSSPLNSSCMSKTWRSGPEPNTPLENMSISISTTFYPGATIDSLPTDLILLSVEPVAFFVHSARLLSVSENGFNQLVSGAVSNKQKDGPDPIIPVPESSAVLNIILQTIYGMSATHFAHTFDDLSLAVASFSKYGLSVSAYLAPPAPLAATLLTHVSTSPLEVYCLAASHDLWHIASSASPHLLSFALPNLTDEQATRMGPIYLKRLFFLHLGRTDALKRLLLPPPCAHAPTTECDYSEQKRVTRAWALASAYLLLDAKPDMGVKTMEAALSPLAEHVDCEMCKAALMERVKEAVVQWSGVKSSI